MTSSHWRQMISMLLPAKDKMRLQGMVTFILTETREILYNLAG